MTDANIPTTPADPPKPRRRWLRLSVRATMALVLILGVILGWFVRRAVVQRDAVLAIQRTGGHVQYSGAFHPGTGVEWWPKWAVRRLGPDYFDDVVLVELGPAATDAEMEHVGRLRRLATLDTSKARVTAAGIAHLEGMAELGRLCLDGRPGDSGAGLAHFRGARQLETLTLDNRAPSREDLRALAGMTRIGQLSLSRTPVGDADLVALDGMADLYALNLRATRITSQGLNPRLIRMRKMETLDLAGTAVDDLSALRGMAKLSWLHLDDTRVEDADLADLRGLDRLSFLSLKGTAVADAGMDHLAGMKALDLLYLDRTRVTDAGLARLARLPTLGVLSLAGTAVTDEGLAHLAGSTKLYDLDLSGTKVTGAGLARLAALPALGSLTIRGTAATPAEIAAFRAAWPRINVTDQPESPAPAK